MTEYAPERTAALTAEVADEVIALHEDFERWFAGTLPTLESVDAALGEEFFFVGPTGTAVDRAGVLAFIGAGKGAQSVSIRIENVVIRWRRGDLIGASYEEWQTTIDGELERTTGRISSAVLERVLEGRNAGMRPLRWLSVHETWLPGAQPPYIEV